MQDSMLSAALLLTTLGLFSVLIQANLEMTQVKQKLRTYETLISKEEFEQQLDSNISLKQDEVDELERHKELLSSQILKLEHKSRKLEAKIDLQSIDAYEAQYDFINSEDYIFQLKNIKWSYHDKELKTQIPTETFPFKTTLGGQYNLDIDAFSSKKESSKIVILQLNLIEIKSGDKVWELSRNYEIQNNK